MEKNAIIKMAQDMQIERYTDESQSNYMSRILYSALCQWMRYSVMDETTKKHDRKSKSYILSRTRELLSIMIEAFPACQTWIYKDLQCFNNIDDVVRRLRDKMLAAKELIEVDDLHNIGLPEYQSVCCSQNYDRIVGLSNEGCKLKHVGITRVIPREKDSDTSFFLKKINSDEYLNWIFDTDRWSDCYNLNGFEFFNPYSNKPPYQSWTNKMPTNVKRVLARLTLYNGMHEYHLILRKEEKNYNMMLSPLLVEWKEERRILLALRKAVGNSMKATYEIKDLVCILNLYCALPTREQSIIDTYCWPLNSINDKYNYVVPIFLWKDIKQLIVEELGIELKEKTNG